MSDPASVLISTAALLAVAVVAGAHGSLRARVAELEKLRPELIEIRRARARDRAAILAVRLIVRRVDRHVRHLLGAPLPPEKPEPDPIGFRPP